MKSKVLMALALIAAFVVSLAGCSSSDLEMDPRLHEGSTPDSTLATIAKAIADKGRTIGAWAYAGAFAESLTTGSSPGFHHIFWPQDTTEWSAVTGQLPPQDWGFDLELGFYTKLCRLRADDYRMEWASDPLLPDNIAANEATIHRHYQVTTHASNGTQTGFLAIGFADLTLLRFADKNWRIVKWEDRRDANADSTDAEQMTLGRRRLNSIQ